MSNKIRVPDFDFTAFYYPQLLEAAIKWMRVNVPEISSETPSDPAIQLLRVYALIGHLNNVLLDQVAHESLFMTAKLRDSLQAHLKLIGYTMKADVPSKTTILITLAKSYVSQTTVVTKGALVSTKRTELAEPIVFEVDSSVTIERTDQITKSFVYDASAGTYTDITTAINTDGSTATILPSNFAKGDIFYVCHGTTMTDRLKFSKVSAATAGLIGYRWEYSDQSVEDTLADSVAISGTGLRIGIDNLLDTDGSIDLSGISVRVTYNPTGEFEDISAYTDGTAGNTGSLYDAITQENYVITSTYLGQTTPSTDPNDYTIGTVWQRIDGITDDTNNGNNTLEKSGNIDFIIPQNSQDNWTTATVNGISGFWLRLRVIAVDAIVAAPTVDRILWNSRNTYITTTVTQGQPRSQDPLGSSTGQPNQVFTLSSTPVIEGSVVIYVNNVAWSQVDNFLNSTNVDNNYLVEIDGDGAATITFGNGTNGRIPTAGSNNIRAEYRTGANINGNVGSNTIINNRSGSGNIKRVTNPRAATGWVEQRGSNDADIELLKVEAPASLRVLERAVTLSDVEYLTKNFTTSDGRQPFKRAKAIDSQYGPKTIGINVVGANGAATTLSDKTELTEYFNGNVSKSIEGVLVVNHAVTVKDYVSLTVDVACTTVGGDKTKIEAAITALIGPTKLKDDGITYQFDFGQDVTISRLTSTILGCDSDTGGVLDVTVTTPANNVLMGDVNLPILGTLTVSVT